MSLRARAPKPTRRAALAGAAFLMAALGGTACSGNKTDSTTTVTGTDTTCELADDVLDAGTVAFQFANKGKKVSELYVLKEDGDTLGEVENVGPGTTATLKVDLVAGDYKIRCKPGQAGAGISQAFEVTGSGGTQTAKADRTVTFDAVDFSYQNLDLKGIAAGDTIRFVMENTGDQPHEFEVLDPKGDAIGEVAAVEKGKSGGATITFDKAGTYTYQCILVDKETKKKHTMLGMTGTFEVASAT